MTMGVFLTLVFIAVVAWARKATPAGDKSGQLFMDSALGSEQPAQLRIASFNIQTGKSNEGKRDIAASARPLKDVHLAGVQEVYAPSLPNLLGIGSPQTQALAEQGKFAWLFCATRRRYLREHRGNAILSKLPVKQWQVEMLPDQSNKSFRNMTVVELSWQGQSFHLINTHLHTRKGRTDQLEVVLQEFAKYPRAILLGDFNSTVSTPELANAIKDVEITDAIAAAGLDLDNAERIDWILTKGFVVDSGHMLEKGVSDHPYYQVSLSYQP